MSVFDESNRLPVNIEEEMTRSYMEYAMSVIMGRALPDVRDGFKPVHRRCLYAMYAMGNEWNKPYRKSARIVGDVIGKYHPHGDQAVYDTIVRLAQDFSMRYPLVDGQGNFGSIDGDPPAAMRYTEVRMSRIAHEVLADIEKETVDFGPNYDGSMTEPLIMPSRIPNLLVNGSSGIAVGMTTNIPPHNLREVIDAVVALIRNPQAGVHDMMRLITGPDFPTAGFIHGRKGIFDAYTTGRGVIKMRARTLIERKARTEREAIIVTELPYQVNKAKLIERIAELVKDKEIEGISDIRDESDREGIRVVLELKKDALPQIVLNHLYKLTPMESSFGIINLALVNGQPKQLDLLEMLRHFVDHRKEVVTRRTIFDLRKAEARAHILEGLTIALDHIDEIVELIKRSENAGDARTRLMERFGFTVIQANAILDLKLQRLTGLEREKIVEEYREVLRLIERLKAILASSELLMQVIVEELEDIKARFGDARRTEIVPEADEIGIEDLIVEEDMVVTVSHRGYIKRNPVSLYRSQRRGGRGRTGMTTREEDFVERVFIASTHHYILVFTARGRVYWIKVYELPQGGPAARGKAIVNLIAIDQGDTVAAVVPVAEFAADRYITLLTRNGIVKKTDLLAYSNPRSTGIIACGVDDGDALIDAQMTNGGQDIFIATREGKAIRFHEDEVRPMGRTARGVIGIRLREGDAVVGMEVLNQGAAILSVTENGYGKRTETEEYRVQARGGQGIITINTGERNGMVAGIAQVTDTDELMLITNSGVLIRMRVADIRMVSRNTKGVKLINLVQESRVVGLARMMEREDEGPESDAGTETGGEEERNA